MKKRLLKLALLCAVAQVTWAEDVNYINRTWNGEAVVETPSTRSNYTEITNNPEQGLEILESSWYVVKGNDVKIPRIVISGNSDTEVHIILCDGAKLTTYISFKETPCHLHIYGQSEGTGKLVADARNVAMASAGIGGIEAQGFTYLAGNVYLHGGKVEAWGNKYGAGIGGTRNDDGGNLTVYGGSIEAHGGKYAAGIGGGQNGNGANITVYGGSVWASGGTDAAGIGSGEQTSGDKHGGSLTVYGGTVYGSGEGWGAGIGGGEDSDGAVVKVYGGNVSAWAGSDAESKSGCAFGSEDGDGHRGSLTIGEKMMVRAGQKPESTSLFTTGERVPACYYRPYAIIKPCDHPSGLTYTLTDGPTPTHTSHCKHCAVSETANHFDSDGTGRCVCGYKDGEDYCTITLATSSNGTNYEGVGVSVSVGNSKPYTLPDCSNIPEGYEFAGWVVNPTSQANGIQPNEGETLLPANSDYNVTGSVNIFARYQSLCISLANNASNYETLSKYKDKVTHSVTLADRTLTKDGNWNTLCLPFDVTIASSPLAGDNVVVKVFDNTSSLSDAGELTLKFTAAPATITAGTPFIIKWDGDGSNNLSNPVFNNVTITSTTAQEMKSTDGKVKFIGNYSPFNITADNINEILYVASGNKIGYSKNERTLKSCRAHFWVQPNGTEAAARTIDIDWGDDVTAMPLIDNGQLIMDNSWYTLDGRRLSGKPTEKGVYISNGKKIVIK